MVDGINRANGGGYVIGGFYGGQNNENVTKDDTQQDGAVVNSYEDTQVDPSKVMDFLSKNNFFVAPVGTTEVGEVDSATKDRVVGYMEQFEMIYGIVVEEFGEEVAPLVMDIVMDKLMGMAA